MHGYARLSRAGLGASFVPLGTLSEACERESRRMNSQAVGNALWAFATLGAPPTDPTFRELELAAAREAPRPRGAGLFFL